MHKLNMPLSVCHCTGAIEDDICCCSIVLLVVPDHSLYHSGDVKTSILSNYKCISEIC
jgi:hypothetical protein